MSEQSPKFRLPVLQAIVLCDGVYTDARTGKKVIAGTFNTLWGHEFPTVFARPTYVYLCLTEVHTETVVQLRYVDLDKDDVLLGLDGLEISASSPLEAVELSVEVPPLPMPRAVATFKEPNDADCEKRFVDDAVVEKKSVEVAFVVESEGMTADAA